MDLITELPSFILLKIALSIDSPIHRISFFGTCKKFKSIENNENIFTPEYWFQLSNSTYPVRNLLFENIPSKNMNSWKQYFLFHYYRHVPSTKYVLPLLKDENNTPPPPPPDGRGGQGMQALKSVIVGSHRVGKSNLILRFSQDQFMDNNHDQLNKSSIVDNYCKTISINGGGVSISLWDTPSLPDYSRLRPLSYPPTDIFIVVFSLVDPGSLWDTAEIWCPEIAYHCPNTPFVLVGAKLDLRDDNNNRHITTQQGMAVAMKIGAVTYIETSAKTGYNVEILFRQIALTVLQGHRGTVKPKRCSVQ